MKCLKVQLELMFKRNLFIVSFTTMILFVAICFVINCLNFYNNDITTVLAAKYLFLGSDLSGYFVEFLKILFPFVATLPFSDSYYEEREKHTIEFCLSRITNETYYYSKLFTCFFGGFIIIAVPLLLNMLLNFIAFPIDSTIDATNFSYIHSYLFDGVMQTGMFQNLFAQNMYLYNFLYLMLLSVTSGLIAVIVYNISFVFKIKRIALLLSAFMVYNFVSLLLFAIGLDGLCMNNYIFAGMFYSGQSLTGMIITFSFLILMSVILIFPAKRKLVECYD